VVGPRDGALKRLIDRYKFGSAVAAHRECVDVLDRRLPVLPTTLTVVAAPTIPAHVRARGFDHTALIAKALATRRGLAYQRVLARRGGAGTQHHRNRRERLRWAAEGLQVIAPAPSDVLLIDDVYTTGATAAACTAALRQAGARNIYIAVLARQELV
jgi:predicted amidophosphoribosyltransferase